jgi:hypothetical protein
MPLVTAEASAFQWHQNSVIKPVDFVIKLHLSVISPKQLDLSRQAQVCKAFRLKSNLEQEL